MIVVKKLKKKLNYGGEDGHSHSYYTLKELIDYQKNNLKSKYSGYVSPEDAKIIDNGGFPNEWCQRTSNKTWVYREWEKEEDLLKPIIDKIYERMRELYFYCSDEEIEKNAGKIRFVFWFDN